MKDVQFVVNEAGEKTAVQIPLEQYEAFTEYMEDEDAARASRESKGDSGRPFHEVLAEMRAAGEVDV